MVTVAMSIVQHCLTFYSLCYLRICVGIKAKYGMTSVIQKYLFALLRSRKAHVGKTYNTMSAHSAGTCPDLAVDFFYF